MPITIKKHNPKTSPPRCATCGTPRLRWGRDGQPSPRLPMPAGSAQLVLMSASSNPSGYTFELCPACLVKLRDTVDRFLARTRK